jgi:hypothetical protein
VQVANVGMGVRIVERITGNLFGENKKTEDENQGFIFNENG